MVSWDTSMVSSSGYWIFSHPEICSGDQSNISLLATTFCNLTWIARRLETRYATAHPSKGFTCDFALLKTEVPSNRDPTHDGFLFSDSFEGYKFSLTGCEADPEGVVVRYKAAAVPVLPGKTGVRAFCTDQTGEPSFWA